MSYSKLTSFDGVTLPIAQPQTDAGTASSRTQVVETISDFFDGHGTQRAESRLPYEISYSCAVAESTAAAMDTTLTALRALRGKRALLQRQHISDGRYEWAWARLVAMRERRTAQHYLFQPVEFIFLVESPWHGAAIGDGWLLDDGEVFDDGLYLDTGVSYSGTSGAHNITYAGTAVTHNIRITLTAGATPITSFNIRFAPPPTVLLTPVYERVFTGTVAANKVLVVDCGVNTVVNDGADAYSDWARTANHNMSYWAGLEPGFNLLTLTLVPDATAATVVLAYDEVNE